LQFDGFSDDGCRKLRGESLVETKLRAIERLGEAGLRTILVCTVQPGVNDHELGGLVEFGVARPWITGISFQPACYVGRHVLPSELERRITFPDVIRRVCEQTSSIPDRAWHESDFSPLPCAHPNAHTLAYAYRAAGQVVPLARFVDLDSHLDLLSGRITFNRERAKELIGEYLSRVACGSDCGCYDPSSLPILDNDREKAPEQKRMSAGRSVEGSIAEEFFERALTEDLAPADMFRITTTSFMDAYNFDVRQEMKACVHFVLPSGHIIPFSAYNLLYRTGRVALPELRKTQFTAENAEVAEEMHAAAR
jgi:uncharacterized radical SAM superfamily Fe-S cluster-containing enzyme